MADVDPHIERAMRRSVARVRLLLALLALGEGYASQIARTAALPPGRVHWVVFGRMPYYRPEDSLAPLGLVVAREGRQGLVYRLTPEGREECERLLEPGWRTS